MLSVTKRPLIWPCQEEATGNGSTQILKTMAYSCATLKPSLIMKAVNSEFKIEEVPTPIPQPNEALVRVHSFGITDSDTLLKDVLPIRQLGIEFSGRIESFGGKEQAGFRTEQSVYGFAISGGAFAEYVACPLETLCPIPRGMSFTSAASIADMWFGALQLLKHDAEMKKRDKILIFNAMCSLGQSTIELAQILGCRRLFAVVDTPKAFEAVEKHLTFRTALPDEIVPLIGSTEIDKKVQRFGQQDLAAVIDLRAKPDLSQGIELLQQDGRIAVIRPAHKLTEEDLTKLVYKRLKLHGATFRARAPLFYKEYRDFLVKHINPKFLNGQLQIRLAKVYHWEDIALAFDLVAHNRELLGKVVCTIVPDF